MYSRFFLILIIIFSLNSQVLAQIKNDEFPFSETIPMGEKAVKIQKYRMQRLKIETDEYGWYIIRGINEELTDEILMRLCNDRKGLEDLNNAKLTADIVTGTGIIFTITGIVLIGYSILGEKQSSNFSDSSFSLNSILSFNLNFNSPFLWAGLGGVILGVVTTFWGDYITPPGEDNPGKHILDIEKVRDFITKYNEDLRNNLGLTIEDIRGIE